MCEAFVWKLEKKYPKMELKEVLWSVIRVTTFQGWEKAILGIKWLNDVFLE